MSKPLFKALKMRKETDSWRSYRSCRQYWARRHSGLFENLRLARKVPSPLSAAGSAEKAAALANMNYNFGQENRHAIVKQPRSHDGSLMTISHLSSGRRVVVRQTNMNINEVVFEPRNRNSRGGDGIKNPYIQHHVNMGNRQTTFPYCHAYRSG